MSDAAPAPDHSTNTRSTNALFNSNKLKLGLFSLNADGGITITQHGAPESAGRQQSDLQ